MEILGSCSFRLENRSCPLSPLLCQTDTPLFTVRKLWQVGQDSSTEQSLSCPAEEKSEHFSSPENDVTIEKKGLCPLPVASVQGSFSRFAPQTNSAPLTGETPHLQIRLGFTCLTDTHVHSPGQAQEVSPSPETEM